MQSVTLPVFRLMATLTVQSEQSTSRAPAAVAANIEKVLQAENEALAALPEPSLLSRCN
jgi:hypothetical protein